VSSRVAWKREICFPAACWTEAEAFARARKQRAVLAAGPCMVRVLTDRFLWQIGRITYPIFGFDDGFVGIVVGWLESLTARWVKITLWGAGSHAEGISAAGPDGGRQRDHHRCSRGGSAGGLRGVDFHDAWCRHGFRMLRISA
jgi:hypothetical protein